MTVSEQRLKIYSQYEDDYVLKNLPLQLLPEVFVQKVVGDKKLGDTNSVCSILFCCSLDQTYCLGQRYGGITKRSQLD